MLDHKDIPLIREEFFRFYYLFMEKELLQNDVISIGNLALFVDYSLHRYKWLETKKKIEKLAEKQDRNELYMFLAYKLYEIAKKLELSDNLEYKIKKMEKVYKEGNLRYFDIVLDPYEFPEWFKRVMEYYPLMTKREYYMKLIRELKKYPFIEDNGNQLCVAYFVDKFYHHPQFLQLVTDLDYKIHYENENETAWFLATQVFRVYYPELSKHQNQEEQHRALKKLAEYKKLYTQKRLRTCDLFSEQMKSQLSISFLKEAF